MTQNFIKNIIGNVAWSYQVNLVIDIPNRKLHILTLFHLSSLGYLQCLAHVAGSFFDWPGCFYSGGLGANRNALGGGGGELGIKLAI